MREETVRRVRNPEGGTNRVWKPGRVDLGADAAVGAQNLRRVVGEYAPRREPSDTPWRGVKSRGVAGASASAESDPEYREAVETAWRLP
jgi:hypothetical protein